MINKVKCCPKVAGQQAKYYSRGKKSGIGKKNLGTSKGIIIIKVN